MPRKPVYPAGLGPRGKRLWRDTLVLRPRLGPGERIMLEEACRLSDRLERLNGLILDAKPLVVNLTDDQREFVVLVDEPMREARMATVALQSVMKGLGLDRLQEQPPAPASPAPVAAEPPAAPVDPLDEIKARREKKDRRDGTDG